MAALVVVGHCSSHLGVGRVVEKLVGDVVLGVGGLQGVVDFLDHVSGEIGVPVVFVF